MDGPIYSLPLISPLPKDLSESVWRPPPAGLLKRARTRVQLVQAAIRVFSARGYAEATMREIASAASMTTATVYNHFKTKDDVARAVALQLAETLCARIAASQQGVEEGAHRLGIGIRRYIWLAEVSPQWALMILDVSSAQPGFPFDIRNHALADLRLGVSQKAFRVSCEMAAADLINGTVSQAMRTVAHGGVREHHGREVTCGILRGLGMGWAEAREIARRPMPAFPALAPLPAPQVTSADAPAARKSASRAKRTAD